jgi:hypothetical protein
MLLQIMEEGHLTDSFGRRVDFRNVVMIMTSNIGADLIKGGVQPFGLQARGKTRHAPIVHEVAGHRVHVARGLQTVPTNIQDQITMDIWPHMYQSPRTRIYQAPNQ